MSPNIYHNNHLSQTKHLVDLSVTAYFFWSTLINLVWTGYVHQVAVLFSYSARALLWLYYSPDETCQGLSPRNYRLNYLLFFFTKKKKMFNWCCISYSALYRAFHSTQDFWVAKQKMDALGVHCDYGFAVFWNCYWGFALLQTGTGCHVLNTAEPYDHVMQTSGGVKIQASFITRETKKENMIIYVLLIN